MAFPDLNRPTNLRRLLAPRLEQNLNGFQGAHIIGSSFWQNSVEWLDELQFPNNQDSLANAVLLPESARGNLELR
jgi:hypothetical protein